MRRALLGQSVKVGSIPLLLSNHPELAAANQPAALCIPESKDEGIKADK